MPKTSHAQTEHAPLNAHNHALLAQYANSLCTAAETSDNEPQADQSHPVERTVSTWRVSILVEGSDVFIGEYATHSEAMRAAQYACEHHPDAQSHDIQPIERQQLGAAFEINQCIQTIQTHVYDHTEHGAQHTSTLYRVDELHSTEDLSLSVRKPVAFYDNLKQAHIAQHISMSTSHAPFSDHQESQCESCEIVTIEHNEATPYKACIVLAHGEVFVVGCYVDMDKASNAIKRMCARLNGVDAFVDVFEKISMEIKEASRQELIKTDIFSDLDKQSSLIKLGARHE